MKKDYITPEINIKLIDFRDILTDSQGDPPEDPGRTGDQYGVDDLGNTGNFFK